ncbi:MAG: hypothetical protein HEQ12_08265 [Aphanizomenon flos-aquae DEX188]|nr:MAG: hypothetical protein HEQ12_08265 [Aphanizomenon flos-aquae DEX188]
MVNQNILILRPKFNIFWAIFIRLFLTFNTSAQITAGEFQILTIHGNEKKVDLKNIISWEISADEASQYLQLDMNQVLETAKNAFSNLILFATADHADNNLIASALGVDNQELQNHPEIAKAAVDNLYDNLTEVISKPSLETSEIVNKYNSELDDLKAVLKAEGIDINQEMEELTQQIQTTLSSEKIQQNLPVIIAGLNKFLKQMETSPEAAGKVIDELLKSLTEEIFIEEEKQLEEQRKEKYKKSAQEAIATSFKSLGLSSFSGGDL